MKTMYADNAFTGPDQSAIAAQLGSAHLTGSASYPAPYPGLYPNPYNAPGPGPGPAPGAVPDTAPGLAPGAAPGTATGTAPGAVLGANPGASQSAGQQQISAVVIQEPSATDLMWIPQPQEIRLWTRDWWACCFCCAHGSTFDFTRSIFCYECFVCGLADQMDESPLAMCLFNWAMIAMLRVKLRTMYSIKSAGNGVFEDICFSIWCPTLSAAQIAKELDRVGYAKAELK